MMSSFAITFRELLAREQALPIVVADKSGLGAGTIRNWLYGTSLPSPAAAWRVAAALPNAADAILLAAIRAGLERQQTRFPGAIGNDDLLGFARPYFFSARLSAALDSGQDAEEYYTKVEAFLKKLADPHFTGEPEICTESSIILLPAPDRMVIRSWREIAEAVAKDSAILYSLSSERFEELIARLLETFGWKVELVGRTGDQGIDVIATRPVQPDVPFRMLVQAKRFAAHRRVGVSYVRELWAVKWKQNFHQAMLASSAFFTRGAKEQAAEWQLSLKDHFAIAAWCRELPRATVPLLPNTRWNRRR